MGIKRVVSTDFWTDSKVVDMFSPEDKLFMLYLLTNPRASLLGIYPLSARIAAFEIGYSVEAIKVLLDRFENKYGIILYSNETQEVAVLNWLKYSVMKGGKPVMDCLESDVKSVKNKNLLTAVLENLKGKESLNITVKAFVDKYVDKYVDKCADQYSITDIDNTNMDMDMDMGMGMDMVYRGRNADVTSTNRNEIEDTCKTASSSACPYQEIVDNFNTICVSLPKVKVLNSKRKQAIKLRWNELKQNKDTFIEVFKKVEESTFLKGENKMNWAASFDWLMGSGNIAKVLEGNYDDRAAKKSKYLF